MQHPVVLEAGKVFLHLEVTALTCSSAGGAWGTALSHRSESHRKPGVGHGTQLPFEQLFEIKEIKMPLCSLPQSPCTPAPGSQGALTNFTSKLWKSWCLPQQDHQRCPSALSQKNRACPGTVPYCKFTCCELPEDEITFFRAVTCNIVFLPSAIEIIIIIKWHGTL